MLIVANSFSTLDKLKHYLKHLKEYKLEIIYIPFVRRNEEGHIIKQSYSFEEHAKKDFLFFDKSFTFLPSIYPERKLLKTKNYLLDDFFSFAQGKSDQEICNSFFYDNPGNSWLLEEWSFKEFLNYQNDYDKSNYFKVSCEILLGPEETKNSLDTESANWFSEDISYHIQQMLPILLEINKYLEKEFYSGISHITAPRFFKNSNFWIHNEYVDSSFEEQARREGEEGNTQADLIEP